MSNLPQFFQFSQGSLQDFLDCPRRFLYRYIHQLAWPALVSEPAREHEQNIRRGELFHRLVEQYLVGLPVENLDNIVVEQSEQSLEEWWESFKKIIPPMLQGTQFTEKILSIPLGGFRLVSKYDLLLFHADGKVTIFDWKTSTRPLKASDLIKRMQTRVYPYVLGNVNRDDGNRGPVQPDQIEMIYWSPAFPASTVKIKYNPHQFQLDHTFLKALIEEIASMPDDQFGLTTDLDHCRFCVYRSLCDRGVKAGIADDYAGIEDLDSSDLQFDFNQIDEIKY